MARTGSGAFYNDRVEQDAGGWEAESSGAAGQTWPPLTGDFVLGSSASSVAVCTLATRSLLPALAGRPEIAIAGRVYTENVGIEKMVCNLLAEPRLAVLVVCGRESRHRVGQAILSLHRNGVDPTTRRIRGATGPEPVLPNLTLEEVAAFRERITIVDLIGEQDAERIVAAAAACGEPRAAVSLASAVVAEQPRVVVAEPDRTSDWTFDPQGFFLIQVDRGRRLVVLEHYDQDRRLRHRIEGGSAVALSQTAIRLGLVSLLTHAAYLGRELAQAELALRVGIDYQQDSPLRLA
jgi:tetrahydromethanopterin S-methyltransferase subunit A